MIRSLISCASSAPTVTPASLFLSAQKGAWYDASDLSTLFQDTAGTTPITTDGQKVALWQDKSGNNIHLTQATAGIRPTYKTTGGKSWVEFNKTNSEYLFYTGTGAGVGVANALLAFRPVGTQADYFSPIANLTDASLGIDIPWSSNVAALSWYIYPYSAGNSFQSSRYRNNQVASIAYAVDTDQVISTDGTGMGSITLELTTGVTMGRDRVYGTRHFNGRIYGAVLQGNTSGEILGTTTQGLIEKWLSAKTETVPF